MSMRARRFVLALVTVIGAALGVVSGCSRSRGLPARTPHAPPREPVAQEAAAPPNERAATVTVESPSPTSAAPTSASPTSAILVTVDGVRWQDVFEGAERSMAIELTRREGLLPRTWDLVGRSGLALGHGAGCGVVRPRNTTHISLPGYLEMFTGKRTTCMSNVCPRVTTPTVLDAATVAGLSVASISSWEVLASASSRVGGSVFVSAGTQWPGARPLEDAKLEDAVVEGEKAKPFPAPGGTYRPDRYTSAIALEYLRVRRPRLFHIGLGDTDEHGHRDDYGAYIAALRDIDTFLGNLAEMLERLHLFESTVVIVVSDHGRANVFREHGPSYPESGRSFVIAFGGRVQKLGAACARHDVWLTDIAATLRDLLDLSRDTSPDADGRPIEEIVQR